MSESSRSSVSSGWLFVTCFVALVATSFAFGTRTFFLSDVQAEFGLSATQYGEIIGAGLWPFAISIVLFSLVIDRVGYKPAMAFAFVCHVVSAVVTILAEGYWGLYVGAFVCALGNGTVEAVINPVIAAKFREAKTKWLTILHAGWPAGIVLGSVLAIGLGENGVFAGLVEAESAWRWKVALVLLPTAAYGLMMLPIKFPVSERVAAGISYRGMLREFGAAGCLIVTGLIVWELTRVGARTGALGLGSMSDEALEALRVGVTAGVTLSFAAAVRSVGHPIFVVLMVMMIPMATTELGTDGWIKALMTPAVEGAFGIDGGWVLVYTAGLMMVLRFLIAPIVAVLAPLGVLLMSSLCAAAGIYGLSLSSGVALIIAAATVYGVGQAFFWPTTLGVVAERFPRGGALTLNGIAAVGMLGVGIIGGPALGNLQDQQIDRQLSADAALYAAVMEAEPETSVFGTYRKLSAEALEGLGEAERAAVEVEVDAAKAGALRWAAVPPLGLAVGYAALMLYYRVRGGYRPVELEEAPPETPEPAGHRPGVK